MKIVDQPYQCTVSGGNFGTWQLQCYLQIFDSTPGQQIVVVSDIGCKTGWFFSYKIEQLANQIVQKFQLERDRLVWIEHCPADIRRPKCSGFSQVSFQWQGGKAINPQWQTLDKKLTATLNETLTQLVAA